MLPVHRPVDLLGAVLIGACLSHLAAVSAPLRVQAVMAWNHDGSLLASASQKGTVLRVHRLPQASKAFTFRCASTTTDDAQRASQPCGGLPLLSGAAAHPLAGGVSCECLMCTGEAHTRRRSTHWRSARLPCSRPCCAQPAATAPCTCSASTTTLTGAGRVTWLVVCAAHGKPPCAASPGVGVVTPSWAVTTHRMSLLPCCNRGCGRPQDPWSKPCVRSSAVSTASGILANVFPGAMADVVDPPRCIATVRLPCQVLAHGLPQSTGAVVPDVRRSLPTTIHASP